MDLLEKLIEYRNIHLAYERVKNEIMNKELYSNIEEEMFSKCIPGIYDNIQDILKNPSEFEFQPLEVLHKPKKITDEEIEEIRPLARMNFFDAVISQSVLNIIARIIKPLLESKNLAYKLNDDDSVYMYENWKIGYSKFLEHELLAINETASYKYVVEVDIKDFYTSVDIHTLAQELSIYIGDDKNSNSSTILKWLDKILSIKKIDTFGKEINTKGLPQGPIYSPLLALFYIHNCFRELKNKQALNRIVYFGYVDDFRFYCENKNQADKIYDEFLKYLENRKLKHKEEKTKIFEINDKKVFEGKLIGKASNFNRAIIDNIILSSESRAKMQKNLKQLIDEAKELFESNKINIDFVDRIDKFALYRIIKLVDNLKDWEAHAEQLGSKKYLTLNFIAMLQVIYTTAGSYRQKRKLLGILKRIIDEESINELTYIKYLCIQFCFKFSPVELKLSNEHIQEYVKLSNEISKQSRVYLKGALSTCHKDWL